MNFNQCTIIGRLCSDLEFRYTPKGAAVVNVNVAVNRNWTGEDGEKHEEVAFIPCTIWNKSAETVGQYAHKGDAILFQGYLRQENWDDKATGQKRSKLVLVVNTFQFLGSKRDAGGEQQERRSQRPPPGSAAARADTAQEDAPPMDNEDSDVPF